MEGRPVRLEAQDVSDSGGRGGYRLFAGEEMSEPMTREMIICGDCLVEMAKMEPNSVDAVVCDPPYGLEFMGKEWDRLAGDFGDTELEIQKEGGRMGSDGVYRKKTRPFSQHIKTVRYHAGKSMQQWHYAWAVEALRVAKPGCHLLAFGGTRTFHRLACAIEDAGWEIRDCLMWVYGSGFPKSESVSLAIDKKACRLELEAKLGRRPTRDEMKAAWGEYRKVIRIDEDFRRRNPSSNFKQGNDSEYAGGWKNGECGGNITAPATDAARQWQGWGTALKPAWEPIILARKPLDGTVAENVQKWGTGAINVDGGRVVGIPWKQTEACNISSKGKKGGAWSHPDFESKRAGFIQSCHPAGRWPANLIHDGSDEVLGLFPITNSTRSNGNPNEPKRSAGWTGNGIGHDFRDSGSAARFFYCAKASRAEREMGLEGMQETVFQSGCGGDMPIDDNGKDRDRLKVKARNHHPTVKPLALMHYLCRLVTPPNGLVLDPFMGSGTTGMAAKAEGFRFIGIDNNLEYCKMAERRIAGEPLIQEFPSPKLSEED